MFVLIFHRTDRHFILECTGLLADEVHMA